METRGPSSGSALSPPGPDPAGTSHDKLRELRDRAHAALEEQRQHMRQLEQSLVTQLETVAGELAEDLVAQARNAAEANGATDDRDTLHRERVDWEAEQALTEAQLQTQLEELRARDYELSQREEQAEVRWLEMTDQQEELAAQLQAGESLKQEMESARAEVDRRQAQLDERQAELDRREAELQSAQEATAAQRNELETAQAALAEEREELERQRGELAQLEQQLTEQKEGLERFQAELDARGAALEQTTKELAEERESLALQQTSLAEGRDTALAELAEKLTQTQQAHDEELTRLRTELEQLATARDDLAAQLAARNEQAPSQDEASEWQAKYEAARQAWESEREKFVQERDKLSSNLSVTRKNLERAQEAQQSDAALEDLQHKFELAVADVHTLRQQNAELEQQLVHRPEVDGSVTSEVVELREERDHLLARIEELERRGLSSEGRDESQELSDLERRFEMAVQEVRELRRQNSDLQEQLERDAKARPATGDDGGMDWEAQKRRLLASLEGDEEDDSPDRVEERTTIEGTIRITDEVIAEKDRQIAELENQMRELADKTPAEDPLTAQHEALLDSDEVIRAEREKLARLEQQLNDALRKAELELSVERAKIARERTHMEELQEELEVFRCQAGGDKTGGKGRGRWLSKLGLGGDEPLG